MSRVVSQSRSRSSFVLLMCLVWTMWGCFCLGSDDENEAATSEYETDRPASSLEGDDERRERTGAMQKGDRRVASVDAVWYQQSTKSGGTSPVEVRVERTPGGKPAVAVMEQHVDGTGNSWQASAWLAAINASRVTQNKLGDHEFIVKSGGFIDGPSAGMLMTATMLALIEGEKIREDTTMTGTINPDGTAGPVGGIPQKIEGAKAKGKKRFGFPIGSQRSLDIRQNKQVDVVAFAEQQGMEAQEIKNLYEAYTFLTGKKLDQPEPVRESDMALGEDLEADLDARMQRMQSKLMQRAAAFDAEQKRTPEQVTSLVVPLLNLSLELLGKGKNEEKAGDRALGYYRYRQASALLSVATLQLRIYRFVVAGKIAEALNALRTEQQKFERLLAALVQDIERASSTGTIGGQVNAVNALMSVQMATTQMQIAQGYFNAIEPTIVKLGKATTAEAQKQGVQQVLTLFALPLRYYALAETQLEIGKDQLQTGLKEGKVSSSSARVVSELASVYTSAAGAGLYNVDALVVEQIAASGRMSEEQASDVLAQSDDAYAMARGATRSAKVLEMNLERGSMELALMELASGVLAYSYAAELVNKYYALHVDSFTQKVSKPRVLILQLEQARVQARQAASLARKKLGFVPSSARFYYQMANSLAAQPEDSDKLYGLSLYWMSSFWSELAMALG